MEKMALGVKKMLEMCRDDDTANRTDTFLKPAAVVASGSSSSVDCASNSGLLSRGVTTDSTSSLSEIVSQASEAPLLHQVNVKNFSLEQTVHSAECLRATSEISNGSSGRTNDVVTDVEQLATSLNNLHIGKSKLRCLPEEDAVAKLHDWSTDDGNQETGHAVHGQVTMADVVSKKREVLGHCSDSTSDKIKQSKQDISALRTFGKDDVLQLWRRERGRLNQPAKNKRCLRQLDFQMSPDMPIEGLMRNKCNSCWLNTCIGALYFSLGTFTLKYSLTEFSPLTCEILDILFACRFFKVDTEIVERILHIATNKFEWEFGQPQSAGLFMTKLLNTDMNRALAQIGASPIFMVMVRCHRCKLEEKLEYHEITVSGLTHGDNTLAHLKGFLKEQYFYCRKCVCPINEKRDITMISLPDLLVIHLMETQNFNSTKSIKLQQQWYSLKSVVVHRPNHFVTYGILSDGSVALYDDAEEKIEKHLFSKCIQEAKQNTVLLLYRKQWS